jgi:hypothetical protein
MRKLLIEGSVKFSISRNSNGIRCLNSGLTYQRQIVALARRLAESMIVPPFTPDPGFTMLFDGADTSQWRMSKITNQPGRDNPGTFLVVDGSLESLPGNDLGLFWNIDPTPPDFILKLEFLRWRDDDNSGVFLRFPDPNSKGYNNTAYVAIDFGFEVQIDEIGQGDPVVS